MLAYCEQQESAARAIVCHACRYEDGDTEHLLWDELAQLLLASNEGKGKKRKSTDKPGGKLPIVLVTRTFMHS